MLGDMGKLLQQAKEMQSKMKEVQKELKTIVVEGSSGGGLFGGQPAIVVKANGEMEVIEVTVNPLFYEKKDGAEAAKLIQAAVNNALKRAKDASAEKLKEATAGLNIPGLPGM